MLMTVEQLREEIYSLPPDQRQELLQSVQVDSQNSTAQLHPTFIAELDRRMAHYRENRSSAIPWEDAEQELLDLVHEL